MNIGMVGTGAIGLPIAERIIQHGFTLNFYARRAEVIEKLQEQGGIYEELERLGENSDVVILFLNTYAQCLECLQKILENMHQGVVVVGSTISPEEMKSLAGLCAEKGVQALAAPVTGGVKGAKDGTLTIMISGSQTEADRVEPVLSSFGGKLVFVGEELGAGMVMKLLVQLLVGINTAAMSEALVLGTKNGLDPQLVYDTLCTSAGTSRILENRGNTVIARNFEKRGTIDILLKDIMYSADMARKSGCPLCLGQACADVFQIGQNTLEDTSQDFSAIVQVYERWSGVTVEKR